MMNNKKRNTIITVVIVGLILLGGFGWFLFRDGLTTEGLSVLEKKWISDHKNNVVDVMVYNDIPIYGYSGNGINFDFLNYFSEKYHVSFNKISYYSTSDDIQGDFGFVTYDSTEKKKKYDISLGEDHYVILSLDNNKWISLDEVDKLGVLKNDKSLFGNYFSKEVEIIEYNSFDDLVNAIKNKQVSYVAVPFIQSMNDILKNQLEVVYHINDLKKEHVLRANDETVYGVMKKVYSEYLKNGYEKDYSKNYLNIYFDATNQDDLSRKNYNSKVYHYGYVVNMPYENHVSDMFVGTLSNYISQFESITDVELEPVSYESYDDVINALNDGSIDLALGNFPLDRLTIKYDLSHSVKNLDYLVLSKKNLAINSIKGLNLENVSVVKSSLLDKLCQDNHINTVPFKNTDDLLLNLDDNSVFIIDKESYVYYKDSSIQNYSILFEDSIFNGYSFVMNKDNKVFNELFDFYVGSISYSDYRYLYHTDISIEKDYTILKIFGFIVALVTFLVSTVLLLNRKNVTNAVVKKDEVLKYVDPMTSLKNRNYLNKNIYSWDENVIFPQGIIVFDLNHIKKINDKYGREVGDDIIKKVASILINHQLENTDIIRSDGDEFIIYMVGYDEDKVSSYMKMLHKKMLDIPKSLGVGAGYSMIFDEVKTVDDAINEAIQMMSQNKNEEEKK